MIFQERSIRKYQNFRIFQSPLYLSIDKTDHITEIVNEWFPTRKCRKFDTPLRSEYTYKKEVISALPWT